MRLRLTTLWLLLLAVASTAMAQDDVFNPAAWGENPVYALAALAGAVAWLRQSKWGAGLDGAIKVAAATLLIGVGGGVVLQLTSMLKVLPFADYNSPLGGVLYGLALAFTAVTGVSIFNYLGSKVRTVNVSVSTGDAGLLALTGSTTNNPIVEFILSYARQAVSAVKLPAALAAVAPLLAQFAQSELILTDDLRSDLQGKVLSLLRKAGLVGVDL